VRHGVAISCGLKEEVQVQMILGVTGSSHEGELCRLAVPHLQRGIYDRSTCIPIWCGLIESRLVEACPEGFSSRSAAGHSRTGESQAMQARLFGIMVRTREATREYWGVTSSLLSLSMMN
jgi:hypothetical protein